MTTDNKTGGDAITGGEKDMMHDAGVDVSSTEGKEPEFVDIDKAVTADDKDLQKIGLTFVEKEPAADLNVLAENKRKESEKKTSETNISDLEREFNNTVGVSATADSGGSLTEKISGLQSMLAKIKEKLGFKKNEVKGELESLKKVKEDIAKDIGNIKELQESEKKIEDQLKKVETIKEEISGIEKEVAEELKS